MGRGQYNSKPLSKLGSKIVSQKDGEYDLERNFKKITPYTKHKRGQQKHRESLTKSYDDEDGKNSSQRGIVDNNEEQPLHSPTGDMPWNSYTRLEDKISNFSEKNDKDHTELRHELEEKINVATTQLSDRLATVEGRFSKYLPISWYKATIAALVAITTVWYMFSYQEVHQLPRQVQEIYQRLQLIEHGLKNIQDSIKVNTAKP